VPGRSAREPTSPALPASPVERASRFRDQACGRAGVLVPDGAANMRDAKARARRLVADNQRPNSADT